MLAVLTGQISPLGRGRRSATDTSLLVAYDTPSVNGATAVNESSWQSVYNGTIFGATVANGAFSFDGVDDYITTPWSGWLSELTIAMWLYRTSTGTTRYILHAGPSSSPPYIRLSTLNVVTVALGATINMTAATAIASATWTNVVVTVPASGMSDGKIYLNATADNPTINNSGSYITPQSSSIIAMRSAGGNLFKGGLGNIRIYNRALSADEVSDLFTAQRAKYGV